MTKIKGVKNWYCGKIWYAAPCCYFLVDVHCGFIVDCVHMQLVFQQTSQPILSSCMILWSSLCANTIVNASADLQRTQCQSTPRLISMLPSLPGAGAGTVQAGGHKYDVQVTFR